MPDSMRDLAEITQHPNGIFADPPATATVPDVMPPDAAAIQQPDFSQPDLSTGPQERPATGPVAPENPVGESIGAASAFGPLDDSEASTILEKADKDILRLIYDKLSTIAAATIRPPGYPHMEGRPFYVIVIEVLTAGTPVNGPDFPVPPGRVVTVRQRRHDGSPVGYVANSVQEVKMDDTRVELGDAESVGFAAIRNLMEIWVDSDTAATKFEIIVDS